MQIGGGGASDINVLQSDAGAFRNKDFTVNQDKAFGIIMQQNGVASEYSHLQLHNPASSGVTAIIDEIYVTSEAVGRVWLTEYSTALATDLGTWMSKNLGGSNGTAKGKRDTNVAILGTIIMGVDINANTPFNISLEYPIIVPENNGLALVFGTVNQTFKATVQGREV